MIRWRAALSVAVVAIVMMVMVVMMMMPISRHDYDAGTVGVVMMVVVMVRANHDELRQLDVR